MEKFSDELSEIAFALHSLGSHAHIARRPTWDEIANHIALRRFPTDGLFLDGNKVGNAVKIRFGNPEGETQTQSDSMILRGRPDVLISYGWDYRDQDRLREFYSVLFIDPEQPPKNSRTPTDYYEGLIASGSPSRLHLSVQIQERTTPGGPTRYKDYPNNLMPANVSDHCKSVVIRALRRIGL